MSTSRPQRLTLPPLEVGRAYVATDFEGFEYSGSTPPESKAILRLHLTNGTSIDLPASDEQLKHLLLMLCEAYGSAAVAHLKMRGWV